MRNIVSRFQFYFALIFIASFIPSCEKTAKTDDSTAQVKFLGNDYFGTCFDNFIGKTFDEVIITNNASYQLFADSIRSKAINLNCGQAAITPIDFSKYSLIGKYTSGGGCSSSYTRQVIDDKANKMIIYKISAKYTGSCYQLFFSYNWALIPRINNDYSVVFQVN